MLTKIFSLFIFISYAGSAFANVHVEIFQKVCLNKGSIANVSWNTAVRATAYEGNYRLNKSTAGLLCCMKSGGQWYVPPSFSLKLEDYECGNDMCAKITWPSGEDYTVPISAHWCEG